MRSWAVEAEVEVEGQIGVIVVSRGQKSEVGGVTDGRRVGCTYMYKIYVVGVNERRQGETATS